MPDNEMCVRQRESIKPCNIRVIVDMTIKVRVLMRRRVVQ